MKCKKCPEIKGLTSLSTESKARDDWGFNPLLLKVPEVLRKEELEKIEEILSAEVNVNISNLYYDRLSLQSFGKAHLADGDYYNDRPEENRILRSIYEFQYGQNHVEMVVEVCLKCGLVGNTIADLSTRSEKLKQLEELVDTYSKKSNELEKNRKKAQDLEAQKDENIRKLKEQIKNLEDS